MQLTIVTTLAVICRHLRHACTTFSCTTCVSFCYISTAVYISVYNVLLPWSHAVFRIFTFLQNNNQLIDYVGYTVYCYGGVTRSRNLHQTETCTNNWHKFIIVFLHNNYWPANHIVPFVLRTGEFLSCDRAMLNLVQETIVSLLEKNLYTIDRHACKFRVAGDIYKFLVGLQLSWACVAGIHGCKRH